MAKDAVEYINEFAKWTEAQWEEGVTTKWELSLARACETLVVRDRAVAEMNRRYVRALKTLRLAKRALRRHGFEDGPTAEEAIDAIEAILTDERIEASIMRKESKNV